MDLEFTINEQTCRLDDKRQQVVNLSENYLVLSFTFSEDWGNTSKFVLYPMEDGTVLRQGISNDKTVVPADVLTGDKFYFTVYGINNNERITTNLVKVNLLKSGYTDDAITPGEDELTPSVVEEIYIALDGKVANTTFEAEIQGIIENINTVYETLDTKSDLGHTHTVTDITDFPNMMEYAKLTDLPTKVSELENDSGYLTEHQSLNEYYTKTEIDNKIHDFENKITLTIDNPIITRGETVDMLVQVRKNGFPVVNKTVNICERSVIATGITNSQGQVTLEYTGTGAGELDLIAECDDLQSEPYTIFDVLFYADEVSDFEIQSGTLTLEDGVFTKSTDGNSNLLNPDNPVRYGWSGAKTIELDVVSRNTLGVQFYKDNDHRFGQRINNLGGTDGCHVKIVYDGTTITPYIDGVEKTSYIVTTTLTDGYMISLLNQGSFKNVVVY